MKTSVGVWLALLLYFTGTLGANHSWLWVGDATSPEPLRIFVLGTVPVPNSSVKDKILPLLEAKQRVVSLWDLSTAGELLQTGCLQHKTEESQLSAEQVESVVSYITSGCGIEKLEPETVQKLQPLSAAWLITRCFRQTLDKAFPTYNFANLPEDKQAEPLVSMDELCDVIKATPKEEQLKQLADVLNVMDHTLGGNTDDVQADLTKEFEKAISKSDTAYTKQHVPHLHLKALTQLMADKLEELPEDGILVMDMPYPEYLIPVAEKLGWKIEQQKEYSFKDIPDPKSSENQDTEDGVDHDDTESGTAKKEDDKGALEEGGEEQKDVEYDYDEAQRLPTPKNSLMSVHTLTMVVLSGATLVVVVLIIRMYACKVKTKLGGGQEMQEIPAQSDDDDSLFAEALEENEGIQNEKFEEVDLHDDAPPGLMNPKPNTMSKNKAD